MTERLFLPIIVVIMSAALVLFGPGSGITSIGDTSVSGNEVANSVSETNEKERKNGKTL